MRDSARGPASRPCTLRQVHRNDRVPETGSDAGIEVVDKAQKALSQAKQAHEERAAAIEAEPVALENRSEAEEVENQAGDRSTPSARLGARPCARRSRAKGFLPSEGLRRLVSYLSFRAIASTSSLRSERGFLPREGVRIRSTCIDRSDTAETGRRDLEDDQLLDRALVFRFGPPHPEHGCVGHAVGQL
jgi:hypothetical protein